MNDGVYYNKLKNLVDSGRLSLVLMVVPPRTNSSLVEHALGNSPDVDHECHEPFLGARKQGFDPDQGYKQIYTSIGGETFEKSGGKTTVAVKEMSHWIGISDEYKNLLELTKKPVLILIRNPLLSVESRIRRVLVTLDMRSSIDLQRWLLDYAATSEGFINWKALLDSSITDAQKERFSFLNDMEGKSRLYDTPILTVQNELLDYMARKDSYVNWRDLIQKKLYTERDYAYFEGIFKANSLRIAFEESEFRELEEQVKYMESNNKPHYILDTTDLRANPEIVMRNLCSKEEISYSTEMINWGNQQVDFHTEQTHEFEKLWYDTLHASNKINPPIDVPPTLSMFPDFVKEYLKTYNLPIYSRLSRNKILPEGSRHELNEKEFGIQVSQENIITLKELGVVSNVTDITNKSSTVPVKLKYIDPVYALTNEPELFNNPEFLTRKSKYADALTLVTESLNEVKREVREESPEIKFK